jgi:ribonucleoside-triphosphate reductase (formate)
MQINISYDVEFDEILNKLKGRYPSELFDLEGIGKQLDINKFSREFFNCETTADVSVDANSNVDGKDIIAYNFELPKSFFRLNSYYLLWETLKKEHNLDYANDVIESQLNGNIYINDFTELKKPYCFNYSSYDIMLEGLPMIKKIKSVKPKYLYSFKSQLEQFVVLAANSTLGATGLADLFIVMSHYVDKMMVSKMDAGFTFNGATDVLQYVKETLVSFIYTINQPMRGNQSPFTNVSVYDKFFLEEMCGDYTFPDGSKPDIKTVQLVQKLFLEVMNEELKRTPVTFPVTTACFSVDDEGNIKDESFLKEIALANLEYGFINIYSGATSTLSSCCRLRSDNTNEYFNSFGAGSTKIGSLGVVTLNLPRIATQAQGDLRYFRNTLRSRVLDAGYINLAKREIIKKRIEEGNMPLYTLGYMDLSKQYCTCGLTGINEAVEIMGYDILTVEGQELVLEWLAIINETNAHMSKKAKVPFNSEQVPAESSSIKLAQKDTLLGMNGSEYPLYSNQFIPLTTSASMLDRIKLQGLFDKHFSGGAIAHINVEQKITEPKLIEELIKVCCKMGVVYWAINYNIQECENGCMGVGKSNKCSMCNGNVINNFSRIVGFLTNVKNWNKVRREADYPNRTWYKGL